MKKRPVVVVTRRLPDVIETRLRELFDTRLNLEDRALSAQELAEAVKTADVLVPTITDEIDDALLDQMGPGLRLIANFGNGVDNIDVSAAVAKGITVTNTPGVLTEDTADMTMALILAVARRLPAAQGPSACRSTTTTAATCRRRSRRSSRRPIGNPSTRCWRAWTSSP